MPKKLFGLYDYQAEAIDRMKNGCILKGGVGSGKSRTSLAYFLLQQKGVIFDDKGMTPSKKPIQDLYVITTARKRDTCDWNGDGMPFLLNTDPKLNQHKHKMIVDSWNNIAKYVNVKGAFFILDEQRLVGRGKWVKSFYKIVKNNNWILLSATPGDNWNDYVPVFVANGFFRNESDFKKIHTVYSYYGGYPKLEKYLYEPYLEKLRASLLVDMDCQRHTVRHYEDIPVDYPREQYLKIVKTRWNPYTDEPIENVSEFCMCLRRTVNSAPSRQLALLEILETHPKAIIFYNHDYELDILRSLGYERGTAIGEWNGHRHEPIPNSDRWVYLVQYAAGCEGWNCIETDTIIFYSQQYSYRVFEQASGRIDRVNTPFTDLYYYTLKSNASIDKGMSQAIAAKKDFNRRKFVGAIDFAMGRKEKPSQK